MKKHINLEHKLIKINAPDILIDQSPKIESESKFELPNHYHGATRTLITDLKPQPNNIINLKIPITSESFSQNEPKAINEGESEVQILYKCPKYRCNHNFLNLDEYQEHIVSDHTKKYRCNISGCIKSYTRSNALVHHQKTFHLGNLPYMCRFCEKKFYYKTGLSYHEKKFHINYVPFACNFPSKS